MTDHRDDPPADRSTAFPTGSGDGEPLTPEAREDAEQDLRATAESIRTDIGRLAALEEAKLALDPEDPRVDAASEAAVSLAERIARETRAELELSRELG